MQECGFSDFIVYVDESGDHGLTQLDPNYPIFVLAFCVFQKRHYSEQVLPALHKFKFKHFGHDLVVLHEHEIRKETGMFKFENREKKQSFLRELTDIIGSTDFILISCVIDKLRLCGEGRSGNNPYHLALGDCLETLYEFMREKAQISRLTHVVVECRGKKEDRELELEFRRICARSDRFGTFLPFEVVFADKKVNASGLQLADLVARPIGLNVLRPGQDNRAFNALRPKFFRGSEAHARDTGLKILPPQKRKASMNLIEAKTPTGFSQST